MPSYMRCDCQNNGRIGSSLVVFDQNGSILNPPSGTRQRFCYQVFASDAQGNVYTPVEYVVIGLGPDVCQNDFYAVNVSINGVMQQVTFGVNAWIVNASEGAGCTGLKLAFPLNNATDIMGVCLTMNQVFAVGQIQSCLMTDGAAYSGYSLPGPLQNMEEACPTTAYQEVDVCLPVTITPYASVGEAVVTCCGAPTISQGESACAGTVGGQCAFTISQRVCVALPVTFGANAQAGEYSVACGEAGEGDCEACGVSAAARQAARRAVENGMIQIRSNGKQQILSDVQRQGCGCSRRAASVNQTVQQTRIQDLIRDPMIWRD